MARNKKLNLLPVGKWDASLTHVVDDMNGEPLNVHKLLANNPPLLNAWWQLRKYVVGGGSLAQRDAEIVILRTAVFTCSWYEWASHVERGLAAGLSVELINSITGGGGAPSQSDNDELLIDVVGELENRGMVQPDTRETFRKRFSELQLMDLIAIRATYIMLSDLLATWEVDVDAHVLAALPDGMTEDTFEESLGDFD